MKIKSISSIFCLFLDGLAWQRFHKPGSFDNYYGKY
jgi:hypothetical protein